jgi:fructokinase
VKDDIQYLFEKLFPHGAKNIVITDGEKGAYVSNGEDIFYLAVTVNQKAETVGAGDAFCSGFLASYIENEDFKRSLAWGIANSGSVVSSVGGANGLLKKKDLKKQGSKLIENIKTIK